MKNRVKKLFDKYYNDDIQYFMSSTKFKFIFQLITFSVGFFITWFFANYTSPAFYGNYLYIISIGSFFSFLSFSGISSSIQQSVARGYERFYTSGMKVMFKYSIMGSIAIFLFSIFYIFFLEVQISVLFSIYIMGLFFPFSSAFSVYHFYLDGKFQFKKDFYYRLISLILQDSLLILLIFFTRNLILHFFLINTFSLILNVNFTRSCIKSLSDEPLNLEKEKQSLKYGFFLSKIGFVATTSANINNILIGMFFNPVLLAFYMIGIGLPTKLLNLIKPTLSTLFSKYSKKDSKLRKSFILFLIILSVLLFFLVIITLPLFMRIFFPGYLDSTIYGYLYSFLILIIPITTAFAYYFRGIVDKRTIRHINLYPNIFKIVFLVPLLLLFEIYGLIFSEYLLWAIRLILLLIAIKRKKN
jgi:O-antigen/teichoic acid export membrane protein